MARLKLLLFIRLVWVCNVKSLYPFRHGIVTPNNAQTGNVPISEGNILEIAMFPPQTSNSLIPSTNDETGVPIQTTATVPTSLITSPEFTISTSTSAATTGGVASIGGTLIQIQIPSSSNIYVNITNDGQVINPTVDVSYINSTVQVPIAITSVVEMSTTSTTIEVTTVGSTNEISSTDSSIIFPTETSIADDSILTTVENTNENTSTQVVVEISTAEAPVELLTQNTAVEMLTMNSTSEVVTESNVEMPTEESTISTAQTTVEMSTTDAPMEFPTETATTTTTTFEMVTGSSTSEVVTTGNTVVVSTEKSTISTVQTTVEMSTIEAPMEYPTETTSIETITASSTSEVVTTENTTVMTTGANTIFTVETFEMSTIDSNIEISTVETSGETTTIVGTTSMPVTNVEVSTTGNTVQTSTTTQTILEVSTTNISTSVERTTSDSTVALPSPGSTVQAITDSNVETSTTEVTVEVITGNRTYNESSSLSAPSIYEYNTTETMTHIQININLSDNPQNGNFGTTTQSPPENLGQLQNRMIYKEKCEEYYASSRTVRKTTVQVFIVGGTSSLPKEYPHMAALGYGNVPIKEWLCGGSLISENYIITAAHCISSKALGDVQIVRLGTTVLNSNAFDYQDFKVIQKISHPNYKSNEQYNDIALLQLDRPVTFTEYISPICLTPSNLTEKVLTAAGWGKIESTGDVSTELQKVELEYFPNVECQNIYSTVSQQDLPRGIVAQTQICAGSRTEVKDTCQGDSGGPLQIQDNGRMYLVGITSFGIGCGKPGRPGVYTRVSYYIPWIENIVWGSGR